MARLSHRFRRFVEIRSRVLYFIIFCCFVFRLCRCCDIVRFETCIRLNVVYTVRIAFIYHTHTHTHTLTKSIIEWKKSLINSHFAFNRNVSARYTYTPIRALWYTFRWLRGFDFSISSQSRWDDLSLRFTHVGIRYLMTIRIGIGRC